MGTDNAGHKKNFLSFAKKAKLKANKYQQLLIYILSNTKNLAINLMMVAYGNRQNAPAFARANYSNLLQSLNHLMESRLNEQLRRLY